MLKIHEIIAKAAGKPLSDEECAELKAMADMSNANNQEESEIIRLQRELAGAIRERDDAKNQLKCAIRKNRVQQIAAQYRFSDPEYLDYLAQKENVNLDNHDDTDKFIQKINQAKPRFFDIEINSGAGGGCQPSTPSTNPCSHTHAASAPSSFRAGHKEIARMLEEAPDAEF